MKNIKRFIAILLAFSLLTPLPVKATEQSSEIQENAISEQLELENSFEMTRFELWDMEEKIYISDTYGSIHTLTPKSITSDYVSSIDLTISYFPFANSTRDSIMYWDLYTENQGVLTYDTYSMVSYFGSSPTMVDFELSQEYFNQEFIYIRMGTLSNYSDTTLSGVTFKKIRNPYFQGTPSPGKVDTVIVSNESLDANTSQSSGTFSVSELNNQMTMDEELPQEAYRVDMQLEFDPSKTKASLVERKTEQINQAYSIGNRKNFWVINNEDNSNYQIEAVLTYAGQYGEIWVNNNEITEAQAKEMSDEFDRKIYPLVTGNFANESDVDGNTKVSVLVYDIQDGFSGSGGYIGGYFYARDLYNQSYSNTSEIFYIDTYPTMGLSKGNYDVSESFSTIAHEFQHMVNFNQNVLVEGGSSMETWLNEALSMSAEHMYLNGPLSSRIQYYERSASIANGHSLLYWDRSGDVLSNYSLSYLFSQYLRIQAHQGTSIYKELLQNPNNIKTSLESIIQKYIASDKTLGEFLSDFRQALYVNEPTGLSGFNSEPGLSEIDSPEYEGPLPRSLRGGGALNIPIEDVNAFSIPADKGALIKYSLIDGASGDVTPPARPVVNPVTDQSTTLTGYGEAGSTITIKAGSAVIGTGVVPSSRAYSVAIPKQKANTTLIVTATDASGNESTAVQVNVTDATPPTAPTVNPVSDQSTAVTGTGEPNASVEVIAGAETVGTGTIRVDGTFSIPINKVIAGTEITVYTRDAAGHVSSSSVIVSDNTLPAAPIVHKVTDQSLSVTGTAEAGSTVTITLGSNILGSGSVSTDGSFSIPIAKQMVGAVLKVSVKDAAGNISAHTEVTVTKAPAQEASRIAGTSRYKTAVAISKEGWETAETVVLATGTDFPDALAGGPLAYKENAPILLTKPTSLLAETEEEIRRLNAKKVIILGSKGAISHEVEAKLNSMGLDVERIGGKNRFDTAALIAKRLPSEQAVIAYGFNFPDVLSISPYAAKNGVPILLTRTDRVPVETMDAMIGRKKSIIVGSSGAISEEVMQQFPQPVRYGGKTRFDTGKEIITNLPMGTEKAYVATGRNFPDALAGSVLAAKNNAPILLVNEKDIPTATKELVPNYEHFSIFGSNGAVNEVVVEELNRALKNK